MCYSKSATVDAHGRQEHHPRRRQSRPYVSEQAGWIDLDLKALGIPHNQNFDVEDLLTGTHYTWHDRSNYVALRPDVQPAHIFRITRQR